MESGQGGNRRVSYQVLVVTRSKPGGHLLVMAEMEE